MNRDDRPYNDRQGSLRGKLLNYTVAMVLIMTIISVLSMSILTVYRSRIDEMFRRNLILDEVSAQLDAADEQLVAYLSTKGSEALSSYMFHEDQLKTDTAQVAASVRDYTEEDLLILDINNLVRNYATTAGQAIQEKRKSNVAAYTELYEEASVIKRYIKTYMNELNVRQLGSNADRYEVMTDRISQISVLNLILILDLLLLSIVIVMNMSSALVEPIVRLAHSAEEIAEGRFGSHEIIAETGDEVEILAEAFNRMKASIQQYIESLKEKAFTEALLMEQEMENIKMQALLDNARLYALQSQMNPHFLFNTINAAVQLSMLEEADRTSEFLETMSRLFRYNIKQLDAEVTVSQEIGNVRDYYELLKVRFGELIHFEFNIDEDVLRGVMPPLILQPIVENAYIHGLSTKEAGGRIVLSASLKAGRVQLEIIDDGVGMSKEKTEEILSMVHQPRHGQKTGGGNGIGMVNVIERLELFYKEERLLTIDSEPETGTAVRLALPYREGVVHD